MIAALVISVLLAALSANVAKFYHAKAQAAEDEARRCRALVVDLRDQLQNVAKAMHEERAASDERARRIRETAAAAARVEARLQSDDVDDVAAAVNSALDL